MVEIAKTTKKPTFEELTTEERPTFEELTVPEIADPQGLPLDVPLGKRVDDMISIASQAGISLEEADRIGKSGVLKDIEEEEEPTVGIWERLGKGFIRKAVIQPLHRILSMSGTGRLDTLLRMHEAAKRGEKPLPELDMQTPFDIFRLDTLRKVREATAPYEAETAAAVAEDIGLDHFFVPPAKTIPEKGIEIGTGVAAFVTKLAVAKKILGGQGLGADVMAFEFVHEIDGGTPGIGALLGLSLGTFGRMPAATLTEKGLRVAAQSGTLAGYTAVAGGTAEEIAVAALLPPVMHALRMFPAMLKGKRFDVKLTDEVRAHYPFMRDVPRELTLKWAAAMRDAMRVKAGELTPKRWGQVHGGNLAQFSREAADAFRKAGGFIGALPGEVGKVGEKDKMTAIARIVERYKEGMTRKLIRKDIKGAEADIARMEAEIKSLTEKVELPGKEPKLPEVREDELEVPEEAAPAEPPAPPIAEAIEPEIGGLKQNIPKEGEVVEERLPVRPVPPKGKRKERKFVTSVKEEFPDLETRVAGEYVPRSTDALSIKARNLIEDSLDAAEDLARTKSTDAAIATASELIKYYNVKAQESKTEADKGIYLDKAADIAHIAAKQLTELGRSVQAASILGRLTPEGQLRFAAKIINDYNKKVEKTRGGLLGLKKKIPQLTTEQTEYILSRVKEIQGMKDGTTKAEAFWSLQQYVYDLIPAPLYRKLINIWKAGLLTGIKTHGLNLSSNLFHGVSESVKDVPAVAVDSIASLLTDKRTVGLTLGQSAKGVVEGAIRGYHYVKTGYDERNVGAKLDWRRVSFGRSRFARWLQAYEQTVFRLMGAGDQPFYYGAKARSIYSQAIATAKTERLSGQEYVDHIEDLIENPTDEMLRYAVIDAETSIFVNRTWLGNIARAVQRVPGGEIIIPFGRTPAAIATQIINYSPVGAVKTLIQNIGKGRFDQRLFSQGIGRAVVGTAVLAVGVALYKAGMMTLRPPKTERERKLWELEGRKPNSIKVGGKWRSPEVLGPAGSVLLIGGYFQQALEEEGSPSKAMGTALTGGARVFGEQTFIRSVNLAAETIMDAERSGELFFSNLSGSLVPTLVADFARATDKTERRVEGLTGRLKTRIPGLRAREEPKINVFGQDLPRYGGNVLETMIDPSRPAKIRQDDVVDELRRLWKKNIKVSPTLLGDKKGYTSLTPAENTELWQSAGQRIYIDLYNLIKGREYARIKVDKEKGKMITNLVKDNGDIARAAIIRSTTRLSNIEKLKEHRESGLLSVDVGKLLGIRKEEVLELED